LDKRDLKIIKALQQDGRASHATIARELGVNETTVRRRVSRLVEEGFIEVHVLADPKKLGFSVSVLFLIWVETPSRTEEVAQASTRLPGMERVSVLAGAADIFVSALLKQEKEILELKRKLAAIPGIRELDTFVVTEVKKRTAGFVSLDRVAG
jgi:Lrp/AsnC family transcriptional regulator for asnA, asnC and gidA